MLELPTHLDSNAFQGGGASWEEPGFWIQEDLDWTWTGPSNLIKVRST